MSLTEKLFKVKERGSSTKTEFLGAVSAYLAVCYLFIVVPGMLADAGMPIGDATVATIWAAVLGTLMIAFIANYPVVVAPGLGISAYFAYYVCGAMGLSWQAACAAVVISGFVFFILTVTRVRQAIIKAIPLDLKLAIVAGIGAFITIIGLKNAGIVVATPSTMIGLGNMMQPQAYLTILGVVLAGWMMAKGIRLAMLITILIVAALGIVTGVTPTDGIHNLFSGSFKIFPTETIFQVDFKQMLTVGIVGVLFSITMVDLFDNMSTLILAGFFALTLFVAPLLTLVPAFATACVLIIVGYMMLQGTASRINFSDITTGLPCFLTIFMMPFTFNIATGLAFGVISFVLLKLLAGKKEEITLTMAVLAVVFVGILISH